MLEENKAAFLNNQIDKFQYMERMFEFHKILYEYAGFIKKSNIFAITIKDGDVQFSFKSNGVDIKMVSIPHDVTSVPFTFLDFGSYESVESEFCGFIVKDGYVVVDVGANSGWYTLNWLKTAHKVKVFSFEPMPELYDNLVKNLVLNGQGTENAFNYGLSNISGKCDFFFDTERCGASSMVNLRGTDKIAKIKCLVKKLDEVFPSLGADRLDIIKCDVEGAEKLVFEGGIETIKKYSPVIFTEMLRKWSKKYDYHPNSIIKMFRDIGYGCYVIKNSKLQMLERVTDNTLETNYIFLNERKHGKILLWKAQNKRKQRI